MSDSDEFRETVLYQLTQASERYGRDEDVYQFEAHVLEVMDLCLYRDRPDLAARCRRTLEDKETA